MPQLQDPGKKDGFTTEALAFAAQYEVSHTFLSISDPGKGDRALIGVRRF